MLTNFSAWTVGLHLAKLKEKYNARKGRKIKGKRSKMPTWRGLLKDRFGGIVGGDVLQWANRRMRVYNTYSEEDIQVAHMDFTTVYNMITFSDAERKKWMQIAGEKLVTNAMLFEKGIVNAHTFILHMYAHVRTLIHIHSYILTCSYTYAPTQLYTRT